MTRRLTAEAHDLTDMPGLCFPADSPEMAEVRQLLNVIEEEHPLLGDFVEVYGTELVSGRDEHDNEQPIMIPDDRDTEPQTGSYTHWGEPVKGQYQGLYITDAYSPEADGAVTVIVHGVLRDSVSYFDEYGNHIIKKYMSYVLAEEDVVIKPVLPVNTHSLRDLARDPAVEELDRLVYEPRSDNKGLQLREIGSLANHLFVATQYDDDHNVQLASYLNATGVLAGVEVYGTDFIYGSREEYIKDQINVIYSRPEKGAVRLDGNAMFDVLPGYRRLSGGGIRFLEPPELFITAQDMEGWNAIPAKSVLEARQTNSGRAPV